MQEIMVGGMEDKKQCPQGYRYGWALVFVYAPEGNFLVKGRSDLTTGYVKEHFPKCIYYMSLWRNGRARGGYWHSTVKGMTIYDPAFRTGMQKDIEEERDVFERRPKHLSPRIRKYKVIVYDRHEGANTQSVEFRRMPKKWLPLYDEMIDKAKIKEVTPDINGISNPSFVVEK